MFENIGKTIKVIAIIFCVLGIIASLIIGLHLINKAMNEPVDYPSYLGPLITTIGILSSLIVNIFIYGFGQLIENSDKIVRLLSKK